MGVFINNCCFQIQIKSESVCERKRAPKNFPLVTINTEDYIQFEHNYDSHQLSPKFQNKSSSLRNFTDFLVDNNINDPNCENDDVSIKSKSLKLSKHLTSSFSKTNFLKFVKLSKGEEQDLPQDHYVKLAPLGMGAYGRVYKVKNIHTSQIRSLKVISKKHAHKAQYKDISKELKILQTLDHPNIIKVFESYEDDHNFFIVSEICQGGDLLAKLNKIGRATEFEAKYIMKQLISSVNYIHERNIIHGDIKMENIMIDYESMCPKNNQYKYEIKLIDFGSSTFILSGHFSKLTEIIGTSHYLSPEAISGHFSSMCDIWSCGIVLYTLLAGEFPFYKHYQNCEDYELFNMIKEGKINFEQNEYISNISKEARDLILSLLQVDPIKRITAKEALRNEWLNKYCEDDCPVESKLKENLRRRASFIFELLHDHRKELKFEHLVKTFFTHYYYNSEDLTSIKEVFKLIDVDNTGTISKQNLLDYLKSGNHNLETKKFDINSMIDKLDFKGLGELEFGEFIEASVETSKLLNEQVLLESYSLCNKHKEDSVTIIRFINFFAKGVEISNDQRMEFKNEIHKLGFKNENINYEKYKSILKSLLNNN